MHRKYLNNVSIYEENQTFNMNVPLNYNMFQMKGSTKYKRR